MDGGSEGANHCGKLRGRRDGLLGCAPPRTPQQLFGWRREARKQTESASDESGACFAPVIVEPSEPHPGAPITAAAPSSTAIVEIVIGSATVRIAPGIDAMTLATVLRAVRAIT